MPKKAEQPTKSKADHRGDLSQHHPSPEERAERHTLPLRDDVDPVEALKALLHVDPEREPDDG